MLRTAFLIVMGLAAAVAPARGGNNGGAALGVETGTTTSVTACTNLVRNDYCELQPVHQTPAGQENYVAVYVGRPWWTGYQLDVMGVDFGIQYSSPAVTVSAWHHCGDLDLGTATWPASGSGVSVVWTTPRTGYCVLVGWFKVTTYAGYGPMSFGAVDHPLNPARVIDSASHFDNLQCPAFGSWDGSPGWNPGCIDISVAPTSWGRIKTQYRD